MEIQRYKGYWIMQVNITEQYSIFSEIFDELQFGVEEIQQEQEKDA